MNLYYYWFYSIYSIYYAFVRDMHYAILAVGLFSVVVSFFILGSTVLLLLLFGVQEVQFFSAIPVVIGSVIIYVINCFLFLPRKRLERLMIDYRDNNSIVKDILAISLTSVSVLNFVLSTILNSKGI